MSALNYKNFVFPDRALVQPKHVLKFLRSVLDVQPAYGDERVKDLAAKFSLMGVSGYKQETVMSAMVHEACQTYGQLPRGEVVSFRAMAERHKDEADLVHDAVVTLKVGGKMLTGVADSSVSTVQAFATATGQALKSAYPNVKPVVVSDAKLSMVRPDCVLAEVTLDSGMTMAQLSGSDQDALVSAVFKATVMQLRKRPPAPQRTRESLMSTRELLERNFVERPQLAAM